MTLGTGSRRRTTRRIAMLLVLFAAQFLMILDGTVVAVALPSIQRDLDLSPESLTWVVNAYVLMFGGFLMVGGRSADLLGPKRVFIAGVVAFTLASLASGLAASEPMLLLARGCQGLAAAIVAPTTLSILSTAFADGSARRRALGIWGGINSAATGAALLVGGVLTAQFSWSAIFLVNVPLGVVIVVVAAYCLADSPRRPAPRGVDVGGAVTLTVGMIALVFTTVNGRERGWTDLVTIGAATLALLALCAFVVAERTHHTPLVRLALFRVRAVTVASAVISVAIGIFVVVTYLLTVYFQEVLGYSALQAGLAFLPGTFSLASSVAAPRLIDRWGSRAVLAGSLGLVGGGVVPLTRIGAADDYATEVLPALILIALGMGGATVTLTILTMTSLPRADAGLAAGLLSTSAQLGTAFWLAVFTGVATAHTAGPEASGLVDGFRTAFWWVAILVVLTMVLVMTGLREPTRRRDRR